MGPTVPEPEGMSEGILVLTSVGWAECRAYFEQTDLPHSFQSSVGEGNQGRMRMENREEKSAWGLCC